VWPVSKTKGGRTTNWPNKSTHLCCFARVTFCVGPKPAKKFRMVERHFFKDKLLKAFDFDFGFCIPNSTNTVEVLFSCCCFPALHSTIAFVAAHLRVSQALGGRR
jgi:hypothetical protein